MQKRQPGSEPEPTEGEEGILEEERTGLERGDGFTEGELIKYANILKKKEASLLTVRGEHNKQGMGENQTKPHVGAGLDLGHWYGPMAHTGVG